MPVTNSERRPLLVTVFATALSSICFGISVFAIGAVWLHLWQQPVMPIIPISRKSDKRRSAPASLESSKVTRSEPLSIIAPKHSPSESVTRRVYFVDSQTTTRRRDSMPQSPRPSEVPVLIDLSPHSSSSTLVSASTPPQAPLFSLDTCEESAAESDNSSRKSAHASFKLPRLISKVHRRALSTPESHVSQSDDPSSSSSLKRSNTGLSFQKHWPISRARASTDNSSQDSLPRPSSSSARISFSLPGSRTVSTPIPASSSAVTPPSPSSASKSKNQLRPSTPNKTPVPRTNPYEYPYFASPPTLLSDKEYNAASDPERTPRPVQARCRERKQINAQAQASLGLGRPLQRQRSASESWVTQGPVVQMN